LKKAIVLGCIILILNSLIPITYSYEISSNNIIYVDDDAIPPYDGTQEHPYKHIQDGIDASINGDTIFVYGGNYPGNISIDKTLNIIGENKETTIIEPNEPRRVGVLILYDGIKFSGFTVRNFPEFLNYGGITIYSENNTIDNNIISNNHKGIVNGRRSNNNVIINNTIENNNIGIVTDEAGILIHKNLIKNNLAGFFMGRTRNSTISLNQFTRNKLATVFFDTENILFNENNFISNSIIAHNFYLSVKYDILWSDNYWGRPRLTPKPILITGWRVFYFFFSLNPIPYPVPIIMFDWNPAEEPYDISIPEVEM